MKFIKQERKSLISSQNETFFPEIYNFISGEILKSFFYFLKRTMIIQP